MQPAYHPPPCFFFGGGAIFLYLSFGGAKQFCHYFAILYEKKPFFHELGPIKRQKIKKSLCAILEGT